MTQKLNSLLAGCRYLTEQQKQAYRDEATHKGITEKFLVEIALTNVNTLTAMNERKRQ